MNGQAPRLTAVRLGALALCLPVPVFAQLRVATWNVTNYDGPSGRDPSFQVIAYGVFQGRQMAPDIILGQEFISAPALAHFVDVLNTAAGSPGDWAAAPFVNGPDTEQVLLYRTSKVHLAGSVVVAVGGTSPNHPRNIMRFDIRPVGYSGAGATIACYCSHMKAGSTQEDQDRRLLEAQRIRNDAETLNPAWNFLLGGDFNIQTSTQAAYVELTGSQPANTGRLFDPIRTPGNWLNTQAFRFVHTQDPGVDMDDRFDQVLMSASLLDGRALDYIGSLTLPYSTTTWNDPNHAYRAWGNDGTCFNEPLTTSGNAMVGPVIAQALITAAAEFGHIPVFLDLRVAAEIDSPVEIGFGTVPQGAPAPAEIEVRNAGDVGLWTAPGIANLNYALAASAGFGAPAGMFADGPGGSGNFHTLTMDTGTPGQKVGTLTITSDAPDEPVRVVTLRGDVVAACYPDCTLDGSLTVADFGCFQTKFVAGDPYSDCNADQQLTIADFGCFQTEFVAGCP